MADTPKDQTVQNWMRGIDERLRTVERRYQELSRILSLQAISNLVGGLPQFFSAEMDDSVSSTGNNEFAIGTLSIPAFSVASIQIATMHAEVNASTSGTNIILRIRAGDIEGNELGSNEASASSSNDILPVAVTAPERRIIGAGVNGLYTVTLERWLGTGTVSVRDGSRLGVLALPLMP